MNNALSKDDLRIRLLIVDDEQSIRKLCVTVGEALGFICMEAESGDSALALLEEQPAHMVLTDMVMPGGVMGGELAENLLAQSPRLKVIYTSGYSPGMAGRDSSLLKGRNFLPKPYSIGKLAQFVRECLDSPSTSH